MSISTVRVVFLVAALAGWMSFGVMVSAQNKTIQLENDEGTGGSFTFDSTWYDDDEEEEYYMVGDTGRIELSYYDAWLNGDIVRKEFVSSNPGVVTVDADGNYQVLAGGDATVSVSGYNAQESKVFSGTYQFKVCYDMSAATLDKTSIQMYLIKGAYGAYGSYDISAMQVSLINAPDLTYRVMDVECSDPSMGIECSLDPETKSFSITAGNEGTATLTITLNGKVFTIDVTATYVGIKKTSAVISKGKTFQLGLTGYHGKVKWASTKKSAVSVSAKGKVRGKKVGNAVVYATVNGHRIGCAVSVVTPKIKKVIEEGKRIARTGTYSQAKRMSAKYYDCSSLVWKAYRKIGKTFGNRNYAPVAADIGKWCGKHKRFIKGGGGSKNVENMKLRPGDLLFKTGAKNGRYKGIYHVEMFVGYECEGYSGDKPILGTLWAARGVGYGGNYLMGRP